MPSLNALLAPLALLIPLSGEGGPADNAGLSVDTAEQAEAVAERRQAEVVRDMLVATHEVPIQHQVRIEQRVIVRVAPQSPSARQNLMAELRRTPTPPRLVERKMEKCVPVQNIAGVQTGSGNQLMLYLRDKRIVSARLEKACLARDFYSGFYVEQNKDGKLCVDRDKLQSRSGANCELKRMRELVRAGD